MIERLLRFQTIPGPYLGGPQSPVGIGKGQAPVFQPLLQPSAPLQPPVQLKSVSQHLQIQMRAPAANPAAPLPQHQPTQIVQRLSQTVQGHVSQHPVQSQSMDAYLQALLLLELMKQGGRGRAKPVEQILPSPFAILSYLPIDRPFARDKPTRFRPSLTGRHFLDFHFYWEREAETSGGAQPHPQAPQGAEV